MATGCGCGARYNVLIDHLDEAISDLGKLKVRSAWDHLTSARDLTEEVAQACSVDLAAVNEAIGKAGTEIQELSEHTKDAIELEKPPLIEQTSEFIAGAVAPERIPAVRITGTILRLTNSAKHAAQDAEMSAVRALEACTTEICACARSVVTMNTVADGVRRSLEEQDAEDVGNTVGLVKTTVEAVSVACGVPAPPEATLKAVAAGADKVAGAIRVPGFSLTTPQAIAKELGRVPSPEETTAMKELERMEREIEKETPEEREARVRNYASLTALHQRLVAEGKAPAGVPAFVPKRMSQEDVELAQEANVFDEYIRLLPAPLEEGQRSILDTAKDRGAFINAFEPLGFTPGQLESLTVDDFEKVLSAVNRRQVTSEQLKAMDAFQVQEFAKKLPAPVERERTAKEREEDRKSFTENMRELGLEVEYKPGEILARPTRGPGLEPLVPSTIRGPPKLTIHRIRKPSAADCDVLLKQWKTARDLVRERRKTLGFPDAVQALVACEVGAARDLEDAAVRCSSEREKVAGIYTTTRADDKRRRDTEHELRECLGTVRTRELAERSKGAFPVIPEPELELVEPGSQRQFQEGRAQLLEALVDSRDYLTAALNACRKTEERPQVRAARAAAAEAAPAGLTLLGAMAQ